MLAATLELYLRNEGFRTERASAGERAVALARQAEPDVVVLDLGLPDLDGTEVLRRIRTVSAVPVVILTARSDEIDELLGLGLGADDYLVKPVSARRLLARVHALLRRSTPSGDGRSRSVTRVGALEVDAYRVQARVSGRRLSLTPSEFRVLHHLARTPGRAVTRAELCEMALPEGDALERAVDLHVTHLRRKLAAAGEAPSIVTVRGVGYALEDDS